jgi:hypothetical protein
MDTVVTPDKARTPLVAQRTTPPPWLVWGVVAAFLVTLIGGAFFLKAESKQERASAARDLQTTAAHKQSEILQWLDMHRRALTIL